jgi:hypothetical protein
MKIQYIICLVLLLLFSCYDNSNSSKSGSDKETEIPKPEPNFERLKLKANEALKFCKQNNYNQDTCILIDMSLHSGVNRFFVWDFKKNEVVHQSIVSHGTCQHNPWRGDNTKENPTFSNVPESHCSSLGKYLIGERGYSQFGVNIKYILHGLDETNSNAQKRVIVFHSWEAIPNQEPFPKGTPEGWGCPAISDNEFLKIDKWLQNKKKVLMWIYND